MAPDRTTDQLTHDEVIAACMTCLVSDEHDGRLSPAKAYLMEYNAVEGTLKKKHQQTSNAMMLEKLEFL